MSFKIDAIRLREKPLKGKGIKYSLLLSLFSAFFPLSPVIAAKQTILNNQPVKTSIAVDSLAKFANSGTLTPELFFYLNQNQINSEQQSELRNALSQRHQLSTAQITRFFNTDLGEEVLDFLGQYLKVEGGVQGKNALLAAILKASFQPQGLSLIDILTNLPTRVDLNPAKLFEFIHSSNLVFQSTLLSPELIGELAAKEAALDHSTDFSQMEDLRQDGTNHVQEEKWTLNDQSRARSFYVLVYKPQQLSSQKTPVIVISHGLAARPEDSEKRARYLASYGYVVAVPQHPGSDYAHTQRVLKGDSNEFVPINEFIDRPRDVTFLIDELERRNNLDFAGKLDLENIGVIGHSFGGYTALALAGAEIDFKYLQKDCDHKYTYLDLARLVQCRALKLPRNLENFKDSRVKAIVLRNPINRSLFGPMGLSKVKIPVVYFSGSYDPLASPIYEQIYPFIWLQTPNKYLALEEGQAHSDSVGLDGGLTQTLGLLNDVIFPKPETLAVYKNTTILAFFEVYLNQNLSYRPYLTSSYASYLSSQEPFKFYWISSTSAAALENEVRAFEKLEGSPEL